MSDENTGTGTQPQPVSQTTGTGTQPQQPASPAVIVDTAATPIKTKKIFSRADIRRYVELKVVLPDLYPDYAPWEFKLRLKLTQDAEERRQEYLALAPSDMTVKEDEQYLDELCDLLVEKPLGFSDLLDDGNGPGSSFKNYVLTSDPATKELLLKIVHGAITLYWRKISPREFRS